MCLGPRQAQWSQRTCERLPDCPHFHLTFSVPPQLWEFFEHNYRVAAEMLFKAVAESLKEFQRNNWKVVEGGFLAVLHTWGSALNWHPHLHVLVSSGGADAAGNWRQVRPGYAFPVRAMSAKVGGLLSGRAGKARRRPLDPVAGALRHRREETGLAGGADRRPLAGLQ